MSSNLIKSDNGFTCINCNAVVGENDNFCKNCGIALSTEATILKSEVEMSIKLETVKEIVNLTKDPKIIDYLKNMKQ